MSACTENGMYMYTWCCSRDTIFLGVEWMGRGGGVNVWLTK